MPRTPGSSPTSSSTSKASARERVAEMQAAEARAARRRRNAFIAGGTVAALALVGGGVYLGTHKGGNSATSASGSDPGASIKGLKVWNNLGREHVDGDPTFAMTPPVGGNHNASWANCGIYDKKIPDKYAVHSLEHGAVWITTNAKASSGDIAALKKLANQDYMLMSQYPTQDSPIVVSAWGHQIKATSAKDPRIKQFINAYLNGPQTPEPGAACSGSYDPNTGSIAGHM